MKSVLTNLLYQVRNGTTVSALAAANGISNPNYIQAGATIKITSGGSSSSSTSKPGTTTTSSSAKGGKR